MKNSLGIGALDAYLSKVVRDGAEKARMSADVTLNGVREIMGIKPF